MVYIYGKINYITPICGGNVKLFSVQRFRPDYGSQHQLL